MTSANLFYFLWASMALTLAPGPDNLLVLSQGIARGRKIAIITALGMCSGISVHTTAAALGLSAVFYSSAKVFALIKYAGAAYLLYLAWRTLRENSGFKPGAADNRPGWELYKRGFVMNVLNPKVALFFLAFLPQFVRQDAWPITLQMILLGLIFMLQAVVIFCLIGYFAGAVGDFIITRPRVAKCFGWITAGIFMTLGIRLALTER